MASSGSGAVKRSLESSHEEEGPVSGSKKVKIKAIEEGKAVEKSQPLQKGKISKKGEDNPTEKFTKKTSPSGSKVNVLKRSNDSLSEDSMSFSPSKKRKTSENTDGLGQSTDKGHSSKEELDKKRKRIKKKAVLKAILDQMEFYFSDSNLRKDRFLRKVYNGSENGYVDLSVFSNFNKLQSLQKDGIRTDIICKAVGKSKLLEVNEDHTKVRRRTPLVELDQEEVDRRTVYVEHLPVHASHTWIRKIFSPCGKVCYVSLPTYQTSKEIKGFAFVEFNSAEEAEKACTMLNNPPPAKTEEKPGKFPKGNKTLNRLQKIAPPIKGEEQDSNEENVLNDSKEEQTLTPTKKKKKRNSKRKSEEMIEKNPVAEQSETQDDKKKKKKKKRRQNLVSEDTTEKELTVTCKTESVVKMKQMPQKGNSKATVSNLKETETEGTTVDAVVKKKKKKKKKKNTDKVIAERNVTDTDIKTETATKDIELKDEQDVKNETVTEIVDITVVKLSRKERKLLRQEDIRRKKAERERMGVEEIKPQKMSEPKQSVTVSESETEQGVTIPDRKRLESVNSESSETDGSSKLQIKRDGSQLTSCLAKSKKQDVVKKVEFDPVPITTEFVERKEVRRRKKAKRESLHLRVLSKKEWLSLKAEYIKHQKFHMAALKESLRELRMQENANQAEKDDNGNKHVDLADVFGTKRMKPSQHIKLAHVEELKFIPNVIVQWKCSHDISRIKIKTMFTEISSDKIAYIEGKEEAKSGYIRFKDEASAEEFARLSRNSDSFSARVLPESQQASYWEKANKDRIAKLGRKKNERGSDKIARKVFERNKVTFKEKGTHVVFEDNDDDNGAADDKGSQETQDNKIDGEDPDKELKCGDQVVISEETTAD